jgi:intracellular multiplication protein IcmV
MGLWSSFKKGADFVFYIRPKQWFGWDFFKSSSLNTYNFLKNVYKIPKTINKIENFEQAVNRHQLTEQQIEIIKNRFYFFSMFFLTCATGITIYACEGFWQHEIMRGIVSLSLVFFLAAQSFRYHFWYFQICEKKLGCTFHDWLSFIKS